MMPKQTVLIVAALVVGYWLAASPASPMPAPPRPADRPVLRWIAKAAKTLLWISLVAERPPQEPAVDHRAARSPGVGADGYPLVDNGRGW